MEALEAFPKRADKIRTGAGLAILIKTDIFKRIMYYTYKDNRGLLYPIPVEKVHEMIALNKGGEEPKDLQSSQVVEQEKDDVFAYEDVTGAIELPAEVRKRRRKKKGGKGGSGQGSSSGRPSGGKSSSGRNSRRKKSSGKPRQAKPAGGQASGGTSSGSSAKSPSSDAGADAGAGKSGSGRKQRGARQVRRWAAQTTCPPGVAMVAIVRASNRRKRALRMGRYVKVGERW